MKLLLGKGSGVLFLAVLFLLLFSYAGGSVAAQATQEAKTIRLQNGESKVLKLGYEVKQVATGAPQVCQVVRTGSHEILVNATGVGQTNIIVWDSEQVREEHSVIVTHRDVTQLTKELESLLGEIEGVKVRTVGSKVAVEGEVFSKKDIDRVSAVLQNIDGVINLTKMSTLLKQILSKEIEKSINNKGVTVRNAKDSFLLEGRVSSQAEKERAEKVASAYTDAVVSVIAVVEKATESKEAKEVKSQPESVQMVQVQLTIMEIENEAFKGMGFHWNPGSSANASGAGTIGRSSGQSETSSISGAITGTISNLLPKLQKLNESGKGRSLFEQIVITKSGSKAHFFVGDDLPIPVAQEGGLMSVQYKKVGLTFDVSPVIDRQGNVESLVEVGSSSVVGEGAGGAPKIRDTRLQSLVYVKSSESITLGGLVGQREAKSLGGSSPGDGLVSINETNRQELRKSQVLVFITPEILMSAADAGRVAKGKAKDEFKAYEYENIQQKPVGK